MDEAGGACVVCGYDRYVGALEFHHLVPAEKRFALSHRGVTRSLAAARQETRRCVLLCANCHAEVEGGLARLPEPGASRTMRACPGQSAVARSPVAQLADALDC